MKKIFFGTPQIAVHFLEKAKELGIVFDTIVTNTDKAVGRKQLITPPEVKVWANNNNIKVLQPEKIDSHFLEQVKDHEVFLVFAYHKILPQELLDIPERGILNIHPSLLPKYRGPSPIMSAVLDDEKNTGVSLMLIDELMDHGPVIDQVEVQINEWKKNEELEKDFAEIGAEIFARNLEDFARGKILPRPQDHEHSIYCTKYSKKDMEMTQPLNSRSNFLKYCAFPKPFYFDKNDKRVVVTKAKWENGNFIVERIIPEGKKERDFVD